MHWRFKWASQLSVPVLCLSCDSFPLFTWCLIIVLNILHCSVYEQFCCPNLIEMFAAKSALLHMKVCRSLKDNFKSAFKFKLEGRISVSEWFTCISFSKVENCNEKKFKPGHAGLGGLFCFSYLKDNYTFDRAEVSVLSRVAVRWWRPFLIKRSIQVYTHILFTSFPIFLCYVLVSTYEIFISFSNHCSSFKLALSQEYNDLLQTHFSAPVLHNFIHCFRRKPCALVDYKVWIRSHFWQLWTFYW